MREEEDAKSNPPLEKKKTTKPIILSMTFYQESNLSTRETLQGTNSINA
jgi:hypothetical protein